MPAENPAPTQAYTCKAGRNGDVCSPNFLSVLGVFQGLQRAINAYLTATDTANLVIKVDGEVGPNTFNRGVIVLTDMERRGVAIGAKPPNVEALAAQAQQYATLIAGAAGAQADFTPVPAPGKALPPAPGEVPQPIPPSPDEARAMMIEKKGLGGWWWVIGGVAALAAGGIGYAIYRAASGGGMAGALEDGGDDESFHNYIDV